MEGRSKEDPKKTRSSPCQNPNSSNRRIIIRRSPALPRPSPALFHGMSDVSPSPFPSLWNQIPLPQISISPAPVPPTGKISPEKNTIRCEKAYVEMCPPCLDPNSDSDPLAKEVTTKVHHEELPNGSGGEKMEISLDCLCGMAHHFFSGHTNLNISISRSPTQTVHAERTTVSGREKLEISLVCSCGRSHNVIYIVSQ